MFNLLKYELMTSSRILDSFNSVFRYSESELEQRENSDSYTYQRSIDKSSKLSLALKDSQKRYAIATEIISDGLWEWNLRSGRIVYSSRWKKTIGCSDRQITNDLVDWLDRVHPQYRECLERNLAACKEGSISQFEIEYFMLHQDGQYRPMYCKCAAVTDTSGKVSHLIGSQVDINQRQIEGRSNYRVLYDRLTNLPNRQLFIQKLEELSSLKPDPNRLVGILCLDLDRFKNVNRNFGYLVGDLLLIEIVHKLKTCLQSHRLPSRLEDRDPIARLGGDEFAILLTGFTNPNYPCELAARIQQEFSEPIRVEEHFILVTLSIGIALPSCSTELCSLNPADNALEYLRNAEIAMHQAKTKGRACNAIFETSIYLRNLKKSKSEDELRKALEQEQFELYYQPIVRLEDRQLVGFEALIRWRHPIKGLISPDEFIPLAEDTGLIVPIGWWVLRSACAQMSQWHQKYLVDSLFISVNITGKQFSQPYAADIIAQIIKQTTLNPDYLKLEITESEIIENINLVLPTVAKLKSLGIQLSMDDFGTGYSSLSYLHYLPIDTLKIDRCFIKGIESDRHQLELVKTIIKLAEVFELDVVAEGIETEQHRFKLLELGCKYGQGYLFHKPISLTMASKLLDLKM